MQAQELINFTEKFVSKTNFWYGEIKGLRLFDKLPKNITIAYNYVNLIFDDNYRFFLLQNKENEHDYALLACSFVESETDLTIDKLIDNAKELNILLDIVKKKHRKENKQEETEQVALDNKPSDLTQEEVRKTDLTQEQQPQAESSFLF